MNRRNQNKRGRRGKRRPRNGRRRNESGNLITRDSPRFPNDIKQNPIESRVIRYLCTTAASNFSITPYYILQQIVATTNGTTNAICIFGSIKLRRISLYYVPPENSFDLTTNTLSFAWAGASNSPELVITDRGTATSPACIKVRPPPNSLASFWYDFNSANVTNNLFTLTCPVGTIMDIDFDFTLQSGSAQSVTLTGAATGTRLAYVIMAGTASGNRFTPDGNVQTATLV